MSVGWRRTLALCACLVLGPSAAFAAGEDRQAAILARAFSYDYSLKQRAGESVTLVLIYRAGNGGSESSADAWARGFKPLEGAKVAGVPFTVVRHAFESAEKLKGFAQEKGADILLVCDGLESDLSAIKEVSREKKLLSVATREPYLQRGLSLGVFMEGERHAIVINLSAASQEGVTFSSDLLRLAKVIR